MRQRTAGMVRCKKNYVPVFYNKSNILFIYLIQISAFLKKSQILHKPLKNNNERISRYVYENITFLLGVVSFMLILNQGFRGTIVALQLKTQNNFVPEAGVFTLPKQKHI